MAKDIEWLLRLANDLAKVSKIGRTGVYLFKNYGIKKSPAFAGLFFIPDRCLSFVVLSVLPCMTVFDSICKVDNETDCHPYK